MPLRISILHSALLSALVFLLSLSAAAYAFSSEIDRARSCHVVESEPFEQLHISASKWPAVSDSGQTRSVRLIYFLPNDRTFNQDVVDTIKARIPRIQTFFRNQMHANGNGNKNFQYETDGQGDPLVHRVGAPYFDASYLRSYRKVGVGKPDFVDFFLFADFFRFVDAFGT